MSKESSFGKKNEYLFIDELEGKKINELNYLLRDMILYLFPNIKDNDIINCYKNVEYEKADICIKVGNKIKYASIKIGHTNSIHSEKITKFVPFLQSIGLGSDVITEILRYHYADGTVDGNGKKRMTVNEYKELNETAIQYVNQNINNPLIIKKIINRFLIQGTQKQSKKIDILIHGTPDDFFFVSKSEVYKYVLSKIKKESSAIHFSLFTFQPFSRVLDYNPKNEYKRSWIQIKWFNLGDSIIEMLNSRITKKTKILENLN